MDTKIQPLVERINVDLATKIIYAFSPSVKVERDENGKYIITITDKDGTTSAIVPYLTLDGIQLSGEIGDLFITPLDAMTNEEIAQILNI